jgi:hypothetical protein
LFLWILWSLIQSILHYNLLIKTIRSLLTECNCTGKKHKTVKFEMTKSSDNYGRYYATCNKFPGPNKCNFFRWLDIVFANPFELKKLGLRTDIIINREDGSYYWKDGKYIHPITNGCHVC